MRTSVACFCIVLTVAGCRDANTGTSDPGFSIADAKGGTMDSNPPTQPTDMSVDVGTVDGARADGPDMENACQASDSDGDGFGVDPSCGQIDCDDTDPSVYPGGDEACNGVDDDCDQQTDEGIKTESCGIGACLRRRECVDGQLTECVPGEPTAEVCNEIDDDCDGQADEEMRVEVVPAQREQLTALVPECRGQREGQLATMECRRAIHLFCAARACSDTGFGPVESNDDGFSVVCLAGTTTYRVELDDLGQQTNRSCKDPDEINEGGCMSAMHHFCTDRGHASGFGPIDLDREDAEIACINQEMPMVTTLTYEDARDHHRGCVHTERRAGRAVEECNTAFHGQCVSEGYVSGLGPTDITSARRIYDIICLSQGPVNTPDESAMNTD